MSFAQPTIENENKTKDQNLGYSIKSLSLSWKPGRLCGLLSAEGYPVYIEWGPPDYRSCGSDDIEVTTGKPAYLYRGGLPNSIAYYCESDSREYVKSVMLTARILNEEKAQNVLLKLRKLISVLFRKLNLVLPSQLNDAIINEKNKEFSDRYVTISVKKENVNIGHILEVKITQKHPAH